MRQINPSCLKPAHWFFVVVVVVVIFNLLLPYLIKLLSYEDRNASQLDLRGSFTDLFVSKLILIHLSTKTVSSTLLLKLLPYSHSSLRCHISCMSSPLMLSPCLCFPPHIRS